MATPKRLARSAKAPEEAQALTDSERLDLIERLNLQVRKSPVTDRWVVWCERESRVDICPATTLRQALDDFARNEWPLKRPRSPDNQGGEQ